MLLGLITAATNTMKDKLSVEPEETRLKKSVVGPSKRANNFTCKGLFSFYVHVRI